MTDYYIGEFDDLNQQLIILKVKCPNCRLINPAKSIRCDCGYDFETRMMKQSLLPDRELQIAKKSRFFRVIAIILAILIPIGVYAYLKVESFQWFVALVIILVLGLFGIRVP